jgi:O-antigen ligase
LKFKYNYQWANLFILFAIIVAYPFSIKICNLFIIVLLVHWLTGIRNLHVSPASRKVVVVLLIPFFLTVISGIYSTSVSEWLHVIEKQIPFLVFPLVLGTIPAFAPSQYDLLLKVVCWSALTSILIFLLFAVNDYAHQGNMQVFYWKNLTDRFSFHPSYFSLFISFSVFYLILKDEGNILFVKKILIIIYAGIMLMLLSSKIHIVLFVLILSIIFFWQAWRTRSVKTIGFVLAAVFLLTLGLWTNPNVKERFSHIHKLSYNLNDPADQFNELTIRFALAECSWKIIKHNWLFGVGAGDVSAELDRIYRQYDYQFGYYNQQNPHNQFLSVWLSTGLIGLLGLLFLLGYSLQHAVIQKDYAHLILLILFMISFLFESMLERQKGIVLFTLLNSIFMFHRYSAHKKAVSASPTD